MECNVNIPVGSCIKIYWVFFLFLASLAVTAPADKKFTEPGAEAPVLPHRALFVLCSFFPANPVNLSFLYCGTAIIYLFSCVSLVYFVVKFNYKGHKEHKEPKG